MYKNDILVSVHMLTYQHVKYIRQALDSILMQKVNFKYEIVIGDDYSTDGTREILKEYKKNYPNKIKLILQKENLGAMKNSIIVKKNCGGKYIAFLEGDDYWIDEYKLQKQIDFLESNKEYIACYTGVEIIGNNSKACKNYRASTWNINSIEDYYRDVPVIPTCTLVLKNLFLNNKKNLKYFTKTKFIGDRIVHALIIKDGKIKYINIKTAVYRFIINNSNSFSSNPYDVGIRDYIKAFKVQRMILPNQYYKLITEKVIFFQTQVIDYYIKNKNYKEYLFFLLKEVEIKELIYIIWQYAIIKFYPSYYNLKILLKNTKNKIINKKIK